MSVIGSVLFSLALLVITPPFAVFASFTLPLAPLKRWRVIALWARAVMWLARVLLGIRHQVVGLENLPKQPAVIVSKHQSAWETIAFQLIFPPHVHVLKRELMWIPFFGWGLAMMSPIPIDRSRGTRAAKRLAAMGRERIDRGFSILIFPEGTRVRPGKRSKYHVGGAWLATRLGVPVVPVAHNAGLVWGRNAFLKRPGTVTVEIGAPISPEGLSPDALNSRLEEWIESRMARLCPA